jgi:hypothetical protein
VEQLTSSTLDERLLSLLAEEITGYLPQFEPYSSDRQMVIYACRDLKEWIKWRLDLESLREVNGRIEEYLERDLGTFRAFLNCWTSLWVAKWRERVEVVLTAPKPLPEVLKRIKDTRISLQNMKHGKELRQLVMQKLLSQGEICVVSFIAEQLVMEEMDRRSITLNSPKEITKMSPLDIFNTISSRISQLSTERGPIVYLSIKPHST